MIVLCEFNSNKEVPELIEKYGFFADEAMHITKGKEYLVYGMINWTFGRSEFPSLDYLIRDDFGDITPYNAKFFKVIDSKLTNVEWHFSFGKNGVNYILAYEDFVNNREHYENALLRDEPDRSILAEWCNAIDSLET